MALTILEGLDRTGKSSVAQYYQEQGYEVVHMSAPPKGITASAYLDEMVNLLMSLNGRNVVLDRSHYGETVWPAVYGRTPLLTDDDIEGLREIEDTLEPTRILMIDPNAEAHWKRCVDNNEPLTKQQFIKARTLYSAMADKYSFERKTLKDFPDAVQPLPQSSAKATPNNSSDGDKAASKAPTSSGEAGRNTDVSDKTKEQLKLERANAINDILSKRIIKAKGPMYDELERGVRHFLNSELGKIFGSSNGSQQGFSNDEINLLKFFCQRLKDKENT